MSSGGLWYREVFADCTSFGLRVERVLHREESPVQLIEVLDTALLGKTLALDGVFMTSVGDEHTYHEMIVHPALVTAPRIERVLIIGGGDGGTAREVLRHPRVQRCVLAEIDERVVAASKAHLPEIGRGAWDDPRLEVRIGDGVTFVREAEASSFDVVILDGSDPIGPATGLFDRAFYEGVARVLTDDGVFALQSESPSLDGELFYAIQRTLREVFPRVHPYFGSVLLYGTGMWTWTWASQSGGPLGLNEERLRAVEGGCRYYAADVHRAAFAQPADVKRRLAALDDAPR